MMLRAHDQLVEEMREQRRINEKLTDTIHDQGIAVQQLSAQVQQLRTAIDRSSTQEGRIAELENRVQEAERNNIMWQKRFAFIGSAAFLIIELARSAYMLWKGP